MPITNPIPTQLQSGGQQYAEGYLTPKRLDTLQVVAFAPERVIPVIFLPGIMGSNLRMNSERQQILKRSNNMAWRPDDKGWALDMLGADADERQVQLDPETTVVDLYEPESNPTGNPSESSDRRHQNVRVTAETPLLRSDPPMSPSFRSAVQKARERGWGEVFFDSYGGLLNTLETRLNLAFQNGKLNPDWRDVIDVDPVRWQLTGKDAAPALTEHELRRVMTNCFYPVHAFGYNWLQSSGDSARALAERIEALMADYQEKDFRCEKVIIVTHSLGGLVGRALCHPAYGNLQDRILGMVHGVMPAIGAAAAYRRMRAGFEGGGIVNRVLGNTGPKVTAVLANAPGGLQLLPSEAYGNDWLRITTKSGKVLKSLPQKGNPYREVYPRTDVWWGLLRENWINPAGLSKAGAVRTIELIERARVFHQDIGSTYHPISYAHYGCDPKQPAFLNVVWEVPDDFPIEKIDAMQIVSDDETGQISLLESTSMQLERQTHPVAYASPKGRRPDTTKHSAYIRNPMEPGDKTVPAHSADHQLQSSRFKGIFRQTGYEHQDSYKDSNAVASTLYSIIRIAQNMDGWAQ